ncbi:MAG: potassium-transporting ATPase subunit C [Frankiaceae bacterium]
MSSLPSWLRQHLAAFRVLIVLTVVVGVAYPLAVTAIAQIPGLKDKANGSLVKANGALVGSSEIGQSFTDADGNLLVQYFQSRPSAAGDGYDPTSTSASNLGPENTVDTLADPASGVEAKQSLLTLVCSRSLAIAQLEHVDGRRPFCTSDGVGAVLGVFRTGGADGPITGVVSLNQACPTRPFLDEYQGVPVRCATPGEDYSAAFVTPIKGDAPTSPAVPPDAVTASGSGLDPDISPAYARLQAARIARVRHVPVAQVQTLIDAHTDDRDLGFMGEPRVNVLDLNLALDKQHPYRAT